MHCRCDSILAVDAGGTSLKWALIRLDELETPPNEHEVGIAPVDSDGSTGAIIAAYEDVIRRGLRRAEQTNCRVLGACISTPGPFDLDRGIPLMKHKYQSVYGKNLRQMLLDRLKLGREFVIRFEYDMDAFLVGEALYGAAKGYSRVIGVTLGSGFGSSFMIDGNITRSAPGLPPDGEVWRVPLGEGIVDDYLSHRGIIGAYKALGGVMREDGGVKAIAANARAGDVVANRVFVEFGATLGRVLMPIARDFGAQCLVFGGQISKSYMLFAGALNEELKSALTLSKVARAQRIDLAPLYGVAGSFANALHIYI